MKELKRPVNLHKAYHAHVYFDSTSLDMATSFYNQISYNFNVKTGRIHQKLVGPHTKWSSQISFGSKEFEALIEWMDKNRNNLSILVHAVTGNDLQDHTEYAYWLGDSIDLDLSIFD